MSPNDQLTKLGQISFSSNFKYKEETLKVWQVFNKNEQLEYIEPISETVQCVERRKWN